MRANYLTNLIFSFLIASPYARGSVHFCTCWSNDLPKLKHTVFYYTTSIKLGLLLSVLMLVYTSNPSCSFQICMLQTPALKMHLPYWITAREVRFFSTARKVYRYTDRIWPYYIKISSFMTHTWFNNGKRSNCVKDLNVDHNKQTNKNRKPAI